MKLTTSLVPSAIVAAVAAVAVGGLLLIWGVSTYNRSATLKNTYEMKVKDNSSEFDNCWKKVQQTAQVTEAQKNALKEIFNGYAQARTGEGGGGTLMKWVQESVPNVDVSVYKQLMNIITGSRDSWTMRQKELVDIAREYNQALAVFPSGLFLKMFGFKVIDPKVITSSRTEKAFESGKDDEVSLPVK